MYKLIDNITNTATSKAFLSPLTAAPTPPSEVISIANLPRYATSNGHPAHCCFERLVWVLPCVSINHFPQEDEPSQECTHDISQIKKKQHYLKIWFIGEKK